jgi:hypothetical protein
MTEIVNLAAHSDRIATKEIGERIKFIASGFEQPVSLDSDPTMAAMCLFIACVRCLARTGTPLRSLQYELRHDHRAAFAGRAAVDPDAGDAAWAGWKPVQDAGAGCGAVLAAGIARVRRASEPSTSFAVGYSAARFGVNSSGNPL